MPSADDDNIPSIITADLTTDDVKPSPPLTTSPVQTLSLTAPGLLSPHSPAAGPRRSLDVPSSPTYIDDGASVITVPPSPSLSSHSSVHFHPTSLALRDNKPELRSPSLLSPLGGNRNTHQRKGSNATFATTVSDATEADSSSRPEGLRHVKSNTTSFTHVGSRSVSRAKRDTTDADTGTAISEKPKQKAGVELDEDVEPTPFCFCANSLARGLGRVQNAIRRTLTLARPLRKQRRCESPAMMPDLKSLDRVENTGGVSGFLDGLGGTIDQPEIERHIEHSVLSLESQSKACEAPDDRHAQGYVNDLLTAWEHRRSLLSMMAGSNREGRFPDEQRKELEDIEAQIGTTLIFILESPDARREARAFTGNDAQTLIDVIQDVLNRGTLPDAASRSQARKLLQKVSEAQEQLPSSLFITGVNDHDDCPTFAGSFGDVYRASYQGRMVALKRIRTFTEDSTRTLKHTRLFCKEALVWQTLRHRFILPLLGIDRSTFAPSLCMVSPWMKNGTVLKYLRDHGQGDVNRLLHEIAQGLDYLHFMNVVHGDLRGTNILISDDENACLSDFGLATTIDDVDSSRGTSTSNRAGSVRWFAPELIHPTKFGCPTFVRTKASDVYTYACVCLELYTQKPPFPYLQDVAALLGVIEGERPEQPPTMPAALWQLVTTAWAEDFRARPSIHDVAVNLKDMVVSRLPP
ncbi:Kinase-like protein [Mycena sanguinolenta]|uniref:Kinase-like protein n=1 Tax=Mycena sanguinolenta TaxID=230812 RepID=A0A8H7CG27_9AGAR|nr:Kinase-like protein [Mycena sanguinolenta]